MSEEEALAADVNAIFVGYAGKMKMLRMIYGAPDSRPIGAPPAQSKDSPKLTPAAFDGMFG
jgi:hypothetical protein